MNTSDVCIPNILQWNCRGFLNKKCEFKLLIQQFKPLAFCLQETHLLPKNIISGFAGFNIYRNDYVDGRVASGGVMLLIHKSIYSESVSVESNCQVVAARVKLPGLDLTLCSIYTPIQNFTEHDFQSIVYQLPQPYLVSGDFNAHNQLWGSSSRNHNGKQIENFFLQNDEIFLLNTLQTTPVNFSYGA